MIDVATLSVIRRWALREHLSLREIARRTGLSRNTIKKYLRADTVEPRYAKRVSPSKLDPFADKLAGWLKTEAGKSRKQRRAVKQMHADLAALGYDGSYNRVVEVLALVLHHDEQAVLAAVELALEAGVPTKMHVLNVLHRLLDSKAPPPPVTAPQALRLVREPLANVNRYDDLRTSERKVRHAS